MRFTVLHDQRPSFMPPMTEDVLVGVMGGTTRTGLMYRGEAVV
jgi:hypothetical protein